MLKPLASQTLIYGLPAILGRLLNYLLVPLYTYNFLPQEYGVVTEMYAYISFLLIVLTYGMETALFNFSVKEKNKEKVYSTILLCVCFTSGIFILLCHVFSQPLSSLIRHAAHPEYVVWFGWILGMDAVTAVAFAKLREQQQAKTFALVKTLNMVTNIFFNLFFIVYCKNVYEENPQSWISAWYSPETGIGYIFISNLIASAMTLAMLLPAFLKIKLQMDAVLLKKILPYSLPLMLAGLAGMTNETIDRILLKYLLPENIALEQVGIYGACYKISIIMTLFIQTFRYATEPFFFARSAERDAPQVYAQAFNYFTVVCMFIFLGTMFNISWIQYFIGEPFRSGLAVVPVLLLANFFLGACFNLSVWYKLTGKTQWGAYMALFGALLTLTGNFLFIPRYGYLASAWTTLVCYASMFFLSYIIGNKHYPVNYDIKRFIAYLTISLILYFVSEQIETTSKTMELVFKNILLAVFGISVGLMERKK